MVVLNNVCLHSNHDVVLDHIWDQDEQKVYIQLTIQSQVNVSDLCISVTNSEFNIKLKDNLVWVCQFYAMVVEASTSVYIKDNKMVLEVEKQVHKKEWPHLENCPIADKQDSDEEETQNPLFDLEFVKNDFYQRDGIVTISLFVKKVIPETVEVTFEQQELDVKFSTRDSFFLKLNEGTSEDTLFHWRITLSNPVIAKECDSNVKPTQLEIKLKKLNDSKWTSLEKTMKKSTTTNCSRKDNWYSLGSTTTPNTNIGVAGGAKSIVGDETQTKKPTCTVLPMSHSGGEDEPAEQPLYQPGFTGLDNMGNTCFMSSVLQVLANTRELREYVLSGSPMKNDLNRENPLGSEGKLMIAFAVLMKGLWSGTHKSIAPKNLKCLVAAKASQFMGYAQHDAQEFMAFLLDILHEDVNRIKKKLYFENDEMINCPDQVLADEAWKRHKARNDSAIVDLFHGQYKSKLVCPECNKVSVTYDPFMELVVPLPKKKHIFSIIFMSRNFQNKPVRYTIQLPEDAIVEELKLSITEKTGVHPSCLRVFRENGGCFHHHFHDMEVLSNFKADYFIFVVEVLSEKIAGEKVIEIFVIQRLLMSTIREYCSGCKRKCVDGRKLKRCTKCFKAAYCDHGCQKQHWNIHKNNCIVSAEPVGVPFIISLPESKANYRRLEQMMEGFARYSVDVFQPPVQPGTSLGSQTSEEAAKEEQDATSNSPAAISSDPAVDESGIKTEVQETSVISTDNCTSPNQKAANNTTTVAGQVQMDTRSSPLFYIKPVNSLGKSLPKKPRLEDKGHESLDLQEYEFLAMDWRNNDKMDKYVLVKSKDLEYEEDVCRSSNDTVTTLEHCIDLFTRPEKLSKEEAWYCPKCKEHREATKEMSIWRLPSTLIIQLKRFSFKNALWRDKINKKVVYPIRGLDLRCYVHGLHHTGPAIYDLYGVINHHGGLLGGHYMAFTRLPSVEHWNKNDIGWRLFDDSLVRAVDEKCIVTQSAYLLFYRQRKPYLSLIQHPVMESVDQVNRKEESIDFVSTRKEWDKSSVSTSSSLSEYSTSGYSTCRDTMIDGEEKSTDMEIID